MTDPRYAGFPDGFFRRADEGDDAVFYAPSRLVTHIDDQAIAAVGRVYDRLVRGPRVLDLMASWVSHFATAPARLTVLGMHRQELVANPQATEVVVHDLNADPTLPFEDGTFDAVTCCVSVDYLVHPVEVFAEVARVLVPGGPFVTTFSNRCFPTKAIRGWLATSDDEHVAIVAEYFVRSGGFGPVQAELATAREAHGDPLYAVWAERV